MHYAVTGSIGHTSKPITEGLLKAGHTVTVITSKSEHVDAIEQMGARAAVGQVDDADFLEQAFAGADAVYLLIPGKPTGLRAFQNQVADSYIAAIRANNIRYAVLLSSIGAHLPEGTGPVTGLYDAEQKLATVEELNNKFLRPAYFMYNLFGMIGMIKHGGITGANFGDEPVALAHTNDIAGVALQELLNLDFTGHQVRYIASDERTGSEIAQVLGAAINKPETPWLVFSDDQNTEGIKGAGLSDELAEGYTSMGRSLREGKMQADYLVNKPTLSATKLEDFARNEFAPAFDA